MVTRFNFSPPTVLNFTDYVSVVQFPAVPGPPPIGHEAFCLYLKSNGIIDTKTFECQIGGLWTLFNTSLAGASLYCGHHGIYLQVSLFLLGSIVFNFNQEGLLVDKWGYGNCLSLSESSAALLSPLPFTCCPDPSPACSACPGLVLPNKLYATPLGVSSDPSDFCTNTAHEMYSTDGTTWRSNFFNVFPPKICMHYLGSNQYYEQNALEFEFFCSGVDGEGAPVFGLVYRKYERSPFTGHSWRLSFSIMASATGSCSLPLDLSFLFGSASTGFQTVTVKSQP